MQQFMIMVLSNEVEEAQLAPAETKALVEGRTAVEREVRSAAAYVDGEWLRPSAEGRRVSVRNATARVDAGPFDASGLSGYYVVQAENLDAALALARKCPVAPGSAIDVRPVMKGHIKPDKRGQQGSVWACAVLGSASSEAAWVQVMDRIDAGSGDAMFSEARFLGGVRLHAPGTGRRVSSIGGQRTVFDGPFLESKEVIGGLMFVRMATIEEAVRWASQTEHAKLGTIEIRELWRS